MYYRTYQNSFKDVRKQNSQTVYLVNLGQNTYNYYNTAAHELGHALGWIGHSNTPNSEIVMMRSDLANFPSTSPLAFSDTIHLNQVY